MENEAVSKNFIEQIIEKDLAEGHCVTAFFGKFRLYKYLSRRSGIL